MTSAMPSRAYLPEPKPSNCCVRRFGMVIAALVDYYCGVFVCL